MGPEIWKFHPPGVSVVNSLDRLWNQEHSWLTLSRDRLPGRHVITSTTYSYEWFLAENIVGSCGRCLASKTDSVDCARCAWWRIRVSKNYFILYLDLDSIRSTGYCLLLLSIFHLEQHHDLIFNAAVLYIPLFCLDCPVAANSPMRSSMTVNIKQCTTSLVPLNTAS